MKLLSYSGTNNTSLFKIERSVVFQGLKSLVKSMKVESAIDCDFHIHPKTVTIMAY